MNQYKVSVIVPIYNVEKYLKKCVDRLINQTLKEIQIILVDDESPDKCGTICDEYAKNNSRITVIHKKNQGLGLARNSGLEKAEGKYVAFVDSDDYVDIDFYEKLYNNACINDSDIVLGGFKWVDKNGKTIRIQENPLQKDVFQDEEIIPNVVYNMIGHINGKIEIGHSACRAIYKKETLDKYNIKFHSEREIISEDFIFNLELFPKCKKISFEDKVYYYYCQANTDSLTRSYNNKRFEQIKILYFETTKRVKEIGIFKETISGINFIFAGYVRVCIKQERMKDKNVALKNIKRICSDKLVQEVFRQKYDSTIKQKMFDYLVKNQKIKLLYKIINKKK